MDKLVQAIARAADEEARRAILQDYVGEWAFLTDPPSYPELSPPFDHAMPRGAREYVSCDYLLGTLGLSFAGRHKRRLIRFIYSGRFGILETGPIQVIDMVWDLEFAFTDLGEDFADWVEQSAHLLPYSMRNELCDQIIEHEAAKMSSQT